MYLFFSLYFLIILVCYLIVTRLIHWQKRRRGSRFRSIREYYWPSFLTLIILIYLRIILIPWSLDCLDLLANQVKLSHLVFKSPSKIVYTYVSEDAGIFWLSPELESPELGKTYNAEYLPQTHFVLQLHEFAKDSEN